MRFLSVIAVALIVVGAGNVMNNSTADQPVCIEKENCALPVEKQTVRSDEDCAVCPDVGCPEHPNYVAGVVAKVHRKPLRNLTGVIVKVPGKVVKVVKVGKAVKVVKVFGRRPARRLLGRVFCRRR